MFEYGRVAMSADVIAIYRICDCGKRAFPAWRRILCRDHSTQTALERFVRRQCDRGHPGRRRPSASPPPCWRGMMIMGPTRAVMFTRRTVPRTEEIAYRAKMCVRLFLPVAAREPAHARDPVRPPAMSLVGIPLPPPPPHSWLYACGFGLLTVRALATPCATARLRPRRPRSPSASALQTPAKCFINGAIASRNGLGVVASIANHQPLLAYKRPLQSLPSRSGLASCFFVAGLFRQVTARMAPCPRGLHVSIRRPCCRSIRLKTSSYQASTALYNRDPIAAP